MLVENQMIKVKWHSQNKQHHINKGYVFTKYKDEFLVKAEDLSHGGTALVNVICDYCGEIFNMQWYHYIIIAEKREKVACYNCRHKKMYERNLERRRNSLYEKALKMCEENGYALLSNKEDILRNTSYIEYSCPIHGKSSMRISNFNNGKGCPGCALAKHSEQYRSSCDDVEKEISKLGGVLLNKNDYINNTRKNLQILCPCCKEETIITSRRHFVQHGGQVCNSCHKKGSNGERRVLKFLEENNIELEQQKWFDDCRDKNPLPFDFYLPTYNTIIEYNGEQHYKDRGYNTGMFSDTLEYTQSHDKIKTDYCTNNNINLITIPYWDYNNIENILTKELISHEDIV